MSKLKHTPDVDLDMLTMALQASDLDIGWLIDAENGEVIPKPDPSGGVGEQAIIKSIQKKPERYIDIEPLPASVLLELMESFTATLDDVEFCELLQEALMREQSAWHFMGTLARNPEEEENWYAFKEQFYALQARQWLREMGYEHIESPAKNISDGIQAKLNQPGEQLLLELILPSESGKRRYVIWQTTEPDIGMTLTAYEGCDQATDQVIGEAAIDNHQLAGINHVLTQFSVQIETMATRQERKGLPTASLSVYRSGQKSELSGVIEAGNIHDQLQTLFNFLLSLTRPE